MFSCNFSPSETYPGLCIKAKYFLLTRFHKDEYEARCGGLKLRRPVQENHEFEASLGYLAKRFNINKRLIALL